MLIAPRCIADVRDNMNMERYTNIYKTTKGTIMNKAILILISALTIHASPNDTDFLSALLMRSTFKLTDGKTFGTAFVLGKPIANDSTKAEYVLITATHVLKDFFGDTAVIYLRTKSGDDYTLLPCKLPIREKGIQKWIQHKSQDVSAMKIAIPTVADIQLCPTTYLAKDADFSKFDVVPGDDVMILGYPMELASNNALFPILRSGKIASYPIVPTSHYPQLLLDFNVFPGNSGGPVFIQSNTRIYGGGTNIGIVRMIVGLVSQQLAYPEEIHAGTQSGILSHSLGVSVVIPSPFIRELVDQLK
jgi:hypothetical protein